MIKVDVPPLQDILDFTDTVFIDPESMIAKMQDNTFHLDYLFNHLPFQTVLFKKKDGRYYYFSDERDTEIYDFAIGYGESENAMIMAMVQWNYDIGSPEVILDASKKPFIFVLKHEHYIDLRNARTNIDFRDITETMEQKTNAVLSFLYLMTLIPPQTIKRNKIKLRAVTVEKTNGLKKKNIIHIHKTEYKVDGSVDLLKSPRFVEYTTKSWTTRGHFRTYKSGKKIWVNPHPTKRSENLLSDRCIDKQSVYILESEVNMTNGKNNINA